MKYRDFQIAKQICVVIIFTFCIFTLLLSYTNDDSEFYKGAYINLLKHYQRMSEPKYIEKYIIKKCDEIQKDKQDEFFEAAKIRGCQPANDKWMRIIHMVMSDAKHFVDIGANKGYTSISFFELWQQNIDISAKKWYKKTGVECGACSDCTSELTPFVDDPCLTAETSFKTSNPNKQK